MVKKNRQGRASVADKNVFIAAAAEEFGSVGSITRAEVLALCEGKGLPIPTWLMSGNHSAGRGMYSIPAAFESAGTGPVVAKVAKVAKPVAVKPVAVEETEGKATSTVRSSDLLNLVPPKMKNFVPFGHFKDTHKIVSSEMFYPLFITGLSGNGKTLGVEQACAKAGRECIRINFTLDTDEDDLLGGFRLVDGETVFQMGPVPEAMERGCVLLLDEIDLGTNKMMCLQPVLEGKPLFLKKAGKIVHPAPGFQIIATANTKGKGDEAGRFIGTNVLNEAFLERFPVTLEQPYPTVSIEKKIIGKELASLGVEDEVFAEKLCAWADTIRKTFYDGGIDEIISTRRLVHISKAYAIWGDKMKAIEVCVARFDDETRESFVELYKKLDADVAREAAGAEEVAAEAEDSKPEELIPF